MGLYGSDNFKTLLLLQIAAKSFQTSLEIFLPAILTKLHSGFLKFSVSDL